MSSDDVPSPSQQRPSTSSFADVFKNLAVGLARPQSPAPSTESSDQGLPNPIEGRRGSRVVFSFEPMHRGSVVSNSSDAAGGPDFEGSLRGLAQTQNPNQAIEEAETVSRSLQFYNAEQSIALWEAGAWLLHHESSEARQSGARLLEAVALRHDLSVAARRLIFEAVAQPSESDVIAARIKSLILLTDHGRRSDIAQTSLLSIVLSSLLPFYEAISAARSKARRAKLAKPSVLYHDETVFADLFQFAVDLITLQRSPPSSEEIQALLEQVCTICKKTSVAADIKNSLAVFDAVILYTEVPEASFAPLLEVLCSIHASVKPLSGPTSRAVRNLAKSRRQAEMVDIVHTFLMESSDERLRNLNVVRGAIKVFVDLIRAHRQDGMPNLEFDRLLTSLRTVADKDDGRIDADVLDLCLNVLEADYVTSALGQDWPRMIDLMILCSRRAIDDSSESSPADETRSNILASVAQIAAALESLWDRLNRDQKLAAGRYLLSICQHIETSQAGLVLNLMRTERLCYPEHPEWEANCVRLIRCFLRPRTRATDIRILALETLKEPFSSEDSLCLFQERGLLDAILDDFSEESDLLFLESLVTFIVEVAVLAKDFDTFHRLVDVLRSSMRADVKRQEPLVTGPAAKTHSRRRSSHSVLELSLANVCSIGLVKIFLRSLNLSAKKVVLVFETLLNLAAQQERPTDSRLTVLKLLFRLRCDSAGSIIVDSTAENDFLTSVLGGSSEVGSKLHATADDHLDGTVAGSDNTQGSQSIRSSQRDSPTSHLSRSLGRTSSAHLRPAKLTPPVWTYASPQVLPEVPPPVSSPYVFAYAAPSAEVPNDVESGLKEALKVNMWLETIISLLQREVDWDVYSYILAHLAAQLSNRDFFHNAIPQIKFLRSVLCDQVKNETFREPPGWTGVKKTDVAVCVFECLSMLVSYHDHFAKSEEDELVRAFMLGIIGSWGGTSRGCIHALSVCCHEIPLSVTKSLNGILDKMTKVITMSNLAVHILEFLALLARLPDVYVNLREEELRAVFGICMRVLQTSREQRYKSPDSQTSRSSQSSTRLSGGVREVAAAAAAQADAAADMPPQDSFSRYVYTLTHHVMVFWFLSLKLQDRAKHVNWITSRLIFKDDSGKETVEEQTQVFIDLMQRVTFSDLGDTIPFETFPPSPADGSVTKKSWIVGMSIVTVETAGVSGLTQLTKRQASGTTYAMYQQRTAPVLAHQVPCAGDTHLHADSMRPAILPSHVMLQLTTTAFPTPTVMQPIPLPDDEITRRALSTFDRNDIVDGHKFGVIYVGDGQTTEAEILANTAGSADYEYFLSGLGTKVQLRGAQFNTQGLHADTDGAYTYAWRDRVSEIVYHVATMMPTDLEGDPNCVNKKRHIGNDFVNIIFNRSNMPYNFDTIPSQFNFVNIVISPVSRVAVAVAGAADDDDNEAGGGSSSPVAESDTAALEKQCYQVKVMSKRGFPEISPAATAKVISGKNLAAFVRILALNASVFSLVWNSPGGEHVSSWRNRLREIKRLRERALLIQSQAPDASEATYPYPGYRRNTKATIHSEELPSRVGSVRTDFSTDWNAAAETNVLQNLDFSRWAR